MNGIAQDFRLALRQVRKSPGFASMVVIALALGMGANTAVFSVMDAVLLRSLPVRDPHRLFYLHIGNGQNQPPSAGNTGNGDTSFSEPVFEALRQRHDVLQDVIAYVPLSFNKTPVRYKETPEEAEGDEVSGNFFSGLSVGILRGRGFSLEDETNHSPVVVISYEYWTRRFARDPSIIGQTLFVKNVPFSIIGITVRGFRGIEPAKSTDFWIPLQNRPELNAWGIPADVNSLYGTPRWWCLLMVARLQPHITTAQAQDALQATFGEAAKVGVGTIDPKRWKPLLDFFPAKGIEGYNLQFREPLRILMGLVLLVLLIACCNVALLLTARNEARQREFSLRLAIGAEKVHLFRQLLAESAVLVAAGATVGWLFAILATRALSQWSSIESGLDPNRDVLLFTLGTSIVCAMLFGVAPLWAALRSPVSGVLRANATNVTHDRHSSMSSRLLMSSQVALCLVLLVAAGLLLRTLRNYQTQNLGMRVDGLLVFGVTPQSAHTPQEADNFFRSLLFRLRNLPGVEDATIMGNRIGSGWSNNNDDSLDGVNLVAKYGDSALIRSNDIGPDYFHVLGVPILQGRDISDADTTTSMKVAVVNETFAKRFLSNTNPIGHKLRNDRTIVGVVRDSKYTSVDEPAMPMAYYAIQDLFAPGTMEVEVRTKGDPVGLLPTIRRALAEMDPNIPLEAPMTQRAQFELSYSEPAMFARLGGFFGALAALLVATGLYGTSSYRTNRRTNEIGVRMALGAERGRVLWMVLAESLLICTIGIAVGLPTALLSTRLLNSMLYELSPFDVASFVLATCAVVFVGAAAALLPAWRAARVDPMVALRYE